MQEITPKEAFQQITEGKAYGIDVRELDEWTAGHAANVTWNPMSSFDENALPTDKPLIMICRSGNRSGQIVQQLIETRSDLFNMVGGMKTWASDGLEILNDTGNPEII